MKPLWNVMRTTMAVIGCLLVYGGISTSDYYVIELGQAEPSGIRETIAIGLILILPSMIHVFRECKNSKEVQK